MYWEPEWGAYSCFTLMWLLRRSIRGGTFVKLTSTGRSILNAALTKYFKGIISLQWMDSCLSLWQWTQIYRDPDFRQLRVIPWWGFSRSMSPSKLLFTILPPTHVLQQSTSVHINLYVIPYICNSDTNSYNY